MESDSELIDTRVSAAVNARRGKVGVVHGKRGKKKVGPADMRFGGALVCLIWQ